MKNLHKSRVDSDFSETSNKILGSQKLSVTLIILSLKCCLSLARGYMHEKTNTCLKKKSHDITKTRLYSFDPLKPHFYIVKLGFTGVYIIFFISAQNIDFGLPRRGGSNGYPQSMF